MEEYRCPRCKEPMDEGHISFSGSTAGYVSEKQTGMIRRATTIKEARLPELRICGTGFGSE